MQIPIVQMRKWRHTECKLLDEEMVRWSLDPDNWAFEAVLGT